MPFLFRGTLEEIDEFPTGKRYRFGPEYWWPLDRSWCVCTDYDLTITVVGGSSQLVAALLSHSILECLEVTPRTRIDGLAPIPTV